DPVDAESASTLENYRVKVWGLKRTKNYGSPHVDERDLKISRAEVLEDGKSVLLHLPEIAPTWCMEIEYKLKGAAGEEVRGTLNNTVHALR
ncbi:MAG: hypothetical protein ACR2RV_09385, partial [Verrucomicrobiales bacterium]